MKTFKNILYVFIVFFLIVPFNIKAQNKEVPITTSSKEALKLFLDGEEKIENAEMANATQLLNKATELDKNFALAYLYLAFSGGGANTFNQNIDKAVSLAEKVSEGERLRILFYQALFDGNGQKQKEYIDQLLNIFPSDKRIHMDAGFYYYNNNDVSEALKHFIIANELDKNCAYVYNMIGYCQSRLYNYSEAEKAFQDYIKLKPKLANPYDSYGELLLKMGKYDESIAQYKKANEVNPMFSSSLVGIGNSYIFKGDYEKARKYYQESYDKSTNIDGKFGALYWIAISYLHEGNTEKALKTYDDYRALAEKEKQIPNIIDSYSKQSWILSDKGRIDEGIKCTNKAIDLIEKSQLSEAEKETYGMYSLLWRCENYIDKGDYDKAKAESEKCKQKLETRKNVGEEMWLNSLLGIMECKLGNYDNSIDCFSKADQESPGNWYQTALVYNKKGDKQNATKLLEKIVACNVNSIDLALVRQKAMVELKK
jgi:tetratricopeptide (TPR) repeat protein